MVSKVYVVSLQMLIMISTINVGNCFSTQSNRYPAGIHPAACPHYPYCDNAALAALHAQPSATHQSNYPAAVNPHNCPNYPYCSHEIPAEAIHYKRSYPSASFGEHHYRGRSEYPSAAASTNAYFIQPLSVHNKYPAGVNPASCPNYPYCH